MDVSLEMTKYKSKFNKLTVFIPDQFLKHELFGKGLRLLSQYNNTVFLNKTT